jgi:hypothetical protein
MSQLLETTPEPSKLIHANYIDTAFANIRHQLVWAGSAETRGTQNLCSAHRPTPVDLDSFYNLPAFLKSNDRWNWLSLYFSCASVSRELLFAARFAHGRREAGIVRPVQG